MLQVSYESQTKRFRMGRRADGASLFRSLELEKLFQDGPARGQAIIIRVLQSCDSQRVISWGVGQENCYRLLTKLKGWYTFQDKLPHGRGIIVLKRGNWKFVPGWAVARTGHHHSSFTIL